MTDRASTRLKRKAAGQRTYPGCFSRVMSAEIVPGKGWTPYWRIHRLDHPNSALPCPQLFRADDIALQIISAEVKQIVIVIVNSHQTSIEVWRLKARSDAPKIL
jgi:hypothetical protein